MAHKSWPTTPDPRCADDRLQAVEVVSTRDAAVGRVLWIVLFLNLLVAALKLVFGFLSGALSMVADGFHSALDASSNVIGLTGMRAARKAPDPEHPYGHRKFEALAALAISLFLFITCYEILSSLIGRLHGEHQVRPRVVTFVAMGLSIVINAFVTRYEQRAAKRFKSIILSADARHTQSDLYASVGVIASLIAALLGFPMLDWIVALVIAGLIAYSGYLVVQSSLSVLSDSQVVDPEQVARIATQVEGVSYAHRVRSRGLPDDIHVDLHIHVARDMNVSDAHELAHECSKRIREEIEGVTDVVIHLEPDDNHDE
ncbi:MAG TPA: cation diffusion facilitator family transporter [Dongiaceae bacterium]|jgi:cation diffusion facilitator family transporter|nr:cation diffusion facilitator family transporter [Dongiaceae bacterium]